MITVRFENQLVVNNRGEVLEGELTKAGKYIVKFISICRKMELTSKEFVALSKMVGFLQVVDNNPLEAKVKDVIKAREIRDMLEFTQNVLADKLYMDLAYKEGMNFNAHVTAKAFLDKKTWTNWRKLRRYF